MRIGRTRHVLLEYLEAKSVVNALLQNPAQLLCPLDDEHILGTRLLCFYGRSQTGRTSADDDHVIFFL
jgi:hypothetical protein